MHVRFHAAVAASVLALSLAACGGGSSTSALAPSQPPTTKQSSGTQRSITSVSGTLKSYDVDRSKTTVAGISSGGFMAVQLQVAFSTVFHYAAIYAGGPYWCAQDSLSNAQSICQYASSSSLAASENYLDQQSAAGTIDNESNLKGQKAYLWSGTSDYTVEQKTMNDLNSEYQHYGVATTYDNTYAAGHGWESLDGTVACGTTGSPYMIDCNGYDSQKTWLTLFYGGAAARNTGALTGTLVNFSQTPYGGGANDLDTNGYLYVPSSCASGTQCKLIVALDGCEQAQANIGTTFITDAGLNEYADTNDILVLYPYQTSSSTPTNPNACWDWWGYETSTYAVKTGPQMAAIVQMVNAIQGTGATPTPTPAPTATPVPTATPKPTASPAPTATPIATATPKPTATPSAAPTHTPTPTPTATAAPACFSGTNYALVAAGRAHQSGGYALANGSNANMGLDNVYYTSTLKETGPNYYVIGCN